MGLAFKFEIEVRLYQGVILEYKKSDPILGSLLFYKSVLERCTN